MTKVVELFELQKLLPIFVPDLQISLSLFAYKYALKRMNKKLITLVLLSCFTINCFAQTDEIFINWDTKPFKKRETRAVWLTTLNNLDWPKTFANSEEGIERQKQELIDILDKYVAANINTILLQTRVRAATIYPSNIEPWDKCLTGREDGNPNYDPLAFAVEECHKRGLEIHAWVAAMPVGAAKSLGCRLMKEKGFSIRSFSTGSYVNPEDPKIAGYLGEICAEITRNYDIDGINLDYIRYPDGWPYPTYRNGDTPETRRENITNIVREINYRVKKLKPWVKISCSPIGKYDDLSRYSSKNYNAKNRVSQDAQLWVKTRIMDQLYPMQYWRGDNYYPFSADWVENSNGHDIVSGLGTYFLDPREGNWGLGEITRQMHVSRWLGMGHAHFRSKFLLDNQQGVYNFEKRFNAVPALTPALTWISRRKPKAPNYAQGTSVVTLIGAQGAKTIRWKGNSPYYNIYMSNSHPVDVKDPRNLVMARFQGTSFVHQGAKHQHYAITAMDRYGNESDALQSVFEKEGFESRLLTKDGETVTIPEDFNAMDIDYFTIETMQGNTVMKIYYVASHRNTLNIYSLKNGTYRLRAHSAKRKVSHKVGYFFIKR